MHENNVGVYEGITLTTGPEKILGVSVGKNIDLRPFWEILIKSVQEKLNIWQSRNLSFQGKTYLINNLGISSLLYALEMKHIDKSFLKTINDIIWTFLWSKKVKKMFLYCRVSTKKQQI